MRDNYVNDVRRARMVAIETLRKHIDVKGEVMFLAIEVRVGTSNPDVALHVASGSRTQGGYIFFVKDLEVEARKKATMVA